MDEGDRDGAFADRGRDSFQISGAYITRCKDPGETGLEQMGTTRERPVRGGQFFR